MENMARHQWTPLFALEAALENIDMDATSSLRNLSKKLFSTEQPAVVATIHEMIAFHWFIEKGLLTEEGIGFPPNWPSEGPPFEGVLVLGGRSLPFDVKDGSGSGLFLLQQELQQIADSEARLRGQAAPKIHVAVNAPTGQRWVRDNFAAITQPFRDELTRLGFQDRLVKVAAGAGEVTIGIGRRAGGSTMAMNERAEFVVGQICGHAEGKHKSLEIAGAKDFILAYLRLPASGLTDFGMEIVPTVFDFLAMNVALVDSLAGVLFLDVELSAGRPRVSSLLWDRHGSLPTALRGVGDVHFVTPAVPPERLHEIAIKANPANLTATGQVHSSPCDLRGKDCEARGAVGSVWIYADADGRGLRACGACLTEFGWGSPVRATSQF